MTAALLLLPLLAVGTVLLQLAACQLHASWRRRSSRAVFEGDLRRWRNAAAVNAGSSEKLARLAAILPGQACAVYELRKDAGLRLLHLIRRGRSGRSHGASLARECLNLLERKHEIERWIDSLQSLETPGAILREAGRLPDDASGPTRRATRLRRILWPWRWARMDLYITRVGPAGTREIWAAGFFEQSTYIPPGHLLAEQMRDLLGVPAAAPEKNSVANAIAQSTPNSTARPGEYEADVYRTAERDILQANRDAHLARVIHDVRLPMTRLFAMLENLQTKVRDLYHSEAGAAPIEQSFARIARQLRTMESFTYDILNLESGRDADRDARPERLDLADRIRQIVDAHIDLIERKKIAVSYEFPEQTFATLIADPLALDRILFNLLTNSFQFCSSPGNLYLTLEARPRHVVLDIEDSGPGLASQENTFELSRRNIGRGGSGWGIGLASARDLSRRLGGRLFATRPRRGKGARFLLVLPGVPAHSGKW